MVTASTVECGRIFDRTDKGSKARDNNFSNTNGRESLNYLTDPYRESLHDATTHFQRVRLRMAIIT